MGSAQFGEAHTFSLCQFCPNPELLPENARSEKLAQQGRIMLRNFSIDRCFKIVHMEAYMYKG